MAVDNRTLNSEIYDGLFEAVMVNETEYVKKRLEKLGEAELIILALGCSNLAKLIKDTRLKRNEKTF